MQDFENITRNTTKEWSQSENSDRVTIGSFTGIFFIFIYCAIFVASTVGNVFVLSVCCSKGRKPRRISVFESVSSSPAFFTRYVASLSIADLVFTQLTLLDFVYAIQGEWVTGQVMCKLQGFLLETCYSASILTLIAISRERLKSVSALQRRSLLQRNKERKLFSLGAWIAAALLCSPLLYAYSIEITAEGNIYCTNHAWKDLGRRIYYSFTTFILFLIPLFIMIRTHARIKRAFRSQVAPNEHVIASTKRRQRKAIRMLGAVTLVFFLCWSPFILVRTLRYFGWYTGEIVWKLGQLIVIGSAAVNPFIYGTYNTKFRVHFKKTFICRCCGNRPSNEREISTVGVLVTNFLMVQFP